jgi:ribosome assembly protein YihI (activator of Der GTPase)
VVEELPELLNGLKDHISKQMNELNIDDQTTVDGLLQQIDVLLGACEF